MSDLDPAFAMYDSWVTHEVTVADLFSHRSGLADHIGDDLETSGTTAPRSAPLALSPAGRAVSRLLRVHQIWPHRGGCRGRRGRRGNLGRPGGETALPTAGHD